MSRRIDPLWGVGVGLLGGAALAWDCNGSFWHWLAGGVAILIVIALLQFWGRLGSRTFWGGMVLLFFFVGGTLGSSRAGIDSDDIALAAPGETMLQGTLQEVIWESQNGKGHLRGRLRVAGRVSGGHSFSATGEVTFFISGVAEEDRNVWVAGNGASMTGDLRIREQYNNPGVWHLWQERSGNGIFRTLNVKNIAQVKWLPEHENRIQGWADRTRQELFQQMSYVMPEKDAALLRGILFGGYQGLDKETKNIFVITGLTHILSVSGTHLAVLLGSLLWLGSCLRIRKRILAPLAASLMLFYGFLCGFPPPIVRSLAMAFAVLLAIWIERESDGQRVFALVVMGMVVWEPRWVYDISFQLSVAATAGLILSAPFLQRRNGWRGFILGPIVLTFAVQVMSLPFLAAYFQQISLGAFIANLFLLPLFEGALLLGLLASLLDMIGASRIFWIGSGLFLGAGLEGSRWLAGVSYLMLPLPAMGFWSGLVYYGGVAGLFFAKGTSRKIWLMRTINVGFLIGLFIFLGQPISNQGQLEVHYIDVGQGDSILIRTPHGRTVLIDTGGIPGIEEGRYDIGERVVAPYLWSLGIHHIDLLLLSHGHEDHAGGLKGVVEKIPASKIWASQSTNSQEKVAGIRKNKNQLEELILESPDVGMIYELDGVTLRVLTQPPAKEEGWSQIIEMTYGDHRWLFTGDLEDKEEKALLASNQLQPVTVLKVGHHGGRKGTSVALLEATKPQVAVISVGEANRFGHPTVAVLGRLKNAQTQVYRTDIDGRIIIRSDGKKLQIERFRNMGTQEKKE